MNLYDWLRGLHVLSVIAWMAGLLMLPRLYAYQSGSIAGGELDTKMKEAARRLRLIILNPAMILTWTFGLTLLFTYQVWRFPWMHLKLLLVVLLSGLHGYYVAEGRRLAAGERRRSEKFWRMVNEVPFVIAVVVVLLATVKPNFFAG